MGFAGPPASFGAAAVLRPGLPAHPASCLVAVRHRLFLGRFESLLACNDMDGRRGPPPWRETGFLPHMYLGLDDPQV